MLVKRAMSRVLPIMDIGEQILKDVYDTNPLQQLDPKQKEAGPFGSEEAIVSNMKKGAIMLLGLAAQKWMMELAEQQEVIAAISDCIMETYAAESTLLRTLKRVARDGMENSSYHIDMMRVFLNDAVMRVEISGRQTLGAIAEGAEVIASVKAFQKLLQWQPINAVAARRRIADRIIEAEGYIFD